MKLSKRLLTIVLSLGMVTPLCSTAYAAEITIDSATIKKSAKAGLYDVNVKYTLTGSSDQVTVLVTGSENTDGIKSEAIVHIDQMDASDNGTCKFIVDEARFAKAGVDTTDGAPKLFVHMGAENATAKATKEATVDTTPTILYGDVNGDGKVNPLDKTILGKYLANWDGVTVDMDASDVNTDGKVNPLDKNILGKYLANWDGYTELPYAAK